MDKLRYLYKKHPFGFGFVMSVIVSFVVRGVLRGNFFTLTNLVESLIHGMLMGGVFYLLYLQQQK